MAKSLNRVQLIGNLTRDPELRYTPNGTAVCSFGLATNRSWTTDGGEKHEETEFHRIVSWNKLAELCSQFLVKGRKVYVEGRITTRNWTGQDGAQRTTTEIIIDDMILLDSKRTSEEPVSQNQTTSALQETVREDTSSQSGVSSQGLQTAAKAKKKQVEEKTEEKSGEEEVVTADDIPF